MSTGDPITPASAESMQRTIGALAARNVEAVLLQSREVALTKLKELAPEVSEVFVNTSETLMASATPIYARQRPLPKPARPDDGPAVPGGAAGLPPQDHHRPLRRQRAGHRLDR